MAKKATEKAKKKPYEDSPVSLALAKYLAAPSDTTLAALAREVGPYLWGTPGERFWDCTDSPSPFAVVDDICQRHLIQRRRALHRVLSEIPTFQGDDEVQQLTTHAFVYGILVALRPGGRLYGYLQHGLKSQTALAEKRQTRGVSVKTWKARKELAKRLYGELRARRPTAKQAALYEELGKAIMALPNDQLRELQVGRIRLTSRKPFSKSSVLEWLAGKPRGAK